MDLSPTSALISGGGAAEAECLSRELRAAGIRARRLDGKPADAEAVFFFFLPLDSLASRIEAVAALRRRLRRIVLLAPAERSAIQLAAEDALRYLAAQRSATISLVAQGKGTSSADFFRKAASLARGAAPARAPVVLLTGASGQIGRAMAALLDESKIPHLDVCRSRPASASRFLSCDLTDPSAADRLAEFCRPATHVIHLASKISNAKELAGAYREQFEVNVGATERLLRSLPPDLRHFAYASSFTVYGGADRPIDERFPVAPGSVYALCKLAVERQLAEFQARTGVPIAILRYASVYGPGPAPGRAIPAMIERLLAGQAPEVVGAGLARRDYVHVGDVCRATLRASLQEAEGVFNIGTGVGTATSELAALLVRLSGSSAAPVFLPQPPGAQAPASFVYDIGKMRRELGFVPDVSLEQGLLDTIRYFKRLPGRREDGPAAAPDCR